MKDQRKRVEKERVAERNYCVLTPNPVPLTAALEGLSVTCGNNMDRGEVCGVK